MPSVNNGINSLIKPCCYVSDELVEYIVNSSVFMSPVLVLLADSYQDYY